MTHLALTRLLQLASPALPVGAYSYSQGLEAAIEAKLVSDEASALEWIEDVLELTIARAEAPLFLRLYDAWSEDDEAAAARWNALFLATRETAELRAETLQMGHSLARLARELGHSPPFDRCGHLALPAAYAWAAVSCGLDAPSALTAYVWSWAENQVMAAVKAVPLGQSAGQRVLYALGPAIATIAERARLVDDGSIGSFAPAFAILSSQHETQYSRLFRS